MSDQQLASLRGRAPEFLLAAELQRRKQMRDADQADRASAQKQGRTVSEELWKSIEPPPPPPMQQPMQQPMMLPPGTMGAEQQGPTMGQMGMFGGGMVRRYDGGGMMMPGPWRGGLNQGPQQPAIDPTQAAIAQMLALMEKSPEDANYRKRAQDMMGGGQDYLGPIAAELAQQKAAPVVGKPSPWQALMRMGAAMMSSRNPTPLGGVGEGLNAALNGYSQDREAYRGDQVRQQQAQNQMLMQRAQIAQQQQGNQGQMARLAEDIAGRDSHAINTRNAATIGVMQQANAYKNQRDLSQMQIDANAPFKDSQIAENLAQAEDRKIKAQVFQSYLKRAGGDPAKAQSLMIRDQAAAQHIDRPREIPFMERVQMNVYQQAIKDGATPAEAGNLAANLKTRKEMTAEKLQERAMRALGLLQKDQNNFNKPVEELWPIALKMVAVEEEAKQEVPPPTGAWDPKRKTIGAIETNQGSKGIGGKGHAQPKKGMTAEDWLKTLQIRPEGSIDARDVYGMFGK